MDNGPSVIAVNELYWAAGFIEGEGWFESSSSFRAACAQKQREPLERLQRIFGGNITQSKIKTGIIFLWRVHGSRAAGVMMTLWPLMSTRRQQQIETTLAKWKAAPGRYGALDGRVKAA